MVIPSFGMNGYSAKNHSFLKVGTVCDLSISSFSRKHVFIPIPGGEEPSKIITSENSVAPFTT